MMRANDWVGIALATGGCILWSAAQWRLTFLASPMGSFAFLFHGAETTQLVWFLQTVQALAVVGVVVGIALCVIRPRGRD